MKIAGFEVWNYQAGEPVKSPTDTDQSCQMDSSFAIHQLGLPDPSFSQGTFSLTSPCTYLISSSQVRIANMKISINPYDQYDVSEKLH